MEFMAVLRRILSVLSLPMAFVMLVTGLSPVTGSVPPTGGFDVFRTFDCRLENTHGTHSLCFVFRGEADEPLRFEDFCFEKVLP